MRIEWDPSHGARGEGSHNSIKKSLSPFNDKKWIEKHGDTFITYSFGHKNIKVGYLIKKNVNIIMLILKGKTEAAGEMEW